MAVYDRISDEVREYWNLTEKYLNDIVRFQPAPSADMLRALEGARHNLRMIISTVNHEAIVHDNELYKEILHCEY